jgi:hypothetical protein
MEGEGDGKRQRGRKKGKAEEKRPSGINRVE